MRPFTRSKRVCFLVTAAVSVLVAAGCGGDGSEEAALGSVGPNGEVTLESNALGKAQFIKRADAICSAYARRIIREYKAYSPKTRPELTAKQRQFVQEVVVPRLEEELDEVSALGAPKGDADEVAAVLRGLQLFVGEIRKQPLSLFKPGQPLADVERRAKAYGFTACGGA